jgi:hypothetical protein
MAGERSQGIDYGDKDGPMPPWPFPSHHSRKTEHEQKEMHFSSAKGASSGQMVEEALPTDAAKIHHRIGDIFKGLPMDRNSGCCILRSSKRKRLRWESAEQKPRRGWPPVERCLGRN